MTTLTANVAFDMTDWDFDKIKAGTIGTFSATKYAVTQGSRTYQFTGAGLTYNASHLLTGGVVTGYRVLDSHGATLLSVNGFSMGASAVETAIQNSDSTGAFETSLFANHNNTLTGSALDDVLTAMSDGTEVINGGDGNDTIIDTGVGSQEFFQADSVFGGNGDDNIYLGANWDGTSVGGGDGYDTVFFDGNYSVQLNLSSIYFTGVEQVMLLGGPNYFFTIAADAVGTDQTLRIDGSNLAAGSKMQMDGSAVLAGNFEMLGGAGNDVLRGGALDDTFWLNKGGVDKVYGGAGADTFYFAGTLNNNDRIHGGAGGSDTVHLNGDYSAGFTFGADTMRGVEQLDLDGDHSYKLTLNDKTVDSGAQLTVIAYTLGAGDKLTLDASALKHGTLGVIDGAGDDVITGGGGDDTIEASRGGHNIIKGGGGDDSIIYFSNLFHASERIDGGTGDDTVAIAGDYSAGLTFNAATMVNVETLVVLDGFDYTLKFADATVASGQTLTVEAGPSGTPLSSDFSLTADGSLETNGHYIMIGGDGDDHLIGGAQDDTFTGGLGADQMKGGGGSDLFVYTAVADSTGEAFDTLVSFNADADGISLPNGVSAIDATVTSGFLDAGTFDANMAAALDSAHLGAGHAVLFTPDSGSYAGETFLVIDQDGTAGYLTGSDIVIGLYHPLNLADLTTGTFAK